MRPVLVLLAGCLVILGCSQATQSTTSSSSTTYNLAFSANSSSSQSLSVTRGGTTYVVAYKLYQNIVYVASPVDKTYESLNVYVPTAINGTSVSTTSVPILLEIGVGGYLSCSTWGTTTLSTNGQYALSAGYVVVQPGCRGRDNGSSGNYYGKAPAAIVDLKAAVRYIRYNSGSIPGNVDRIVSSGGSAGGALSALLGASGNSTLYSSALTTLGAASAKDNIYAVGAWSPITDLDHADMCYEWEYGAASYSGTGTTVNSTISGALQTNFETYEDDLELSGLNSYGTLTSSNVKDYILTTFLEPSAAKYIASNGNSWSWITSSSGSATFTFSDYVSAIGRSKSVPAFDSFFDVSGYSNTNTSATAEAIEFGDPSSSTAERHFTAFSLGYAGGSSISSSLQTVVNMMNPLYFIVGTGAGTSTLAGYWYIRDGTTASDTSAIVIVNLATALANKLGATASTTASTTATATPVNAWEDWNTGHNVNTDPSGFLTWIGTIQ